MNIIKSLLSVPLQLCMDFIAVKERWHTCQTNSEIRKIDVLQRKLDVCERTVDIMNKMNNSGVDDKKVMKTLRSFYPDN